MLRLTQALLIALVASGAAAQAQTYPAVRPIKLVVPFPAGGPIDALARTMAEPLGGALGQKIVVENVAGAGGTLAAAQVAKAEPDGHTVMLHHVGMATTAFLYKKLPYDAKTQFAPIGIVTELPTILAGRPDLPAKSAAEAIAYLKSNADKVSLGHAGIGSATHLCTLLLMKSLDVAPTSIPYKGTAQALVDLMAGRIDVMCDGPTPATKSNVELGRIKGLISLTRERLAALPNVPTVHELGLKDFEFYNSHSLYAPAGTPPDVIARLSDALKVTLRDRNVIERFNSLGAEPASAERATPQAARAKLVAEFERWGPLIIAAGVSAE